MRKREEVIGKAGAVLAVLVGVALIAGLITVFNAERIQEDDQARGAITTLNNYRTLNDQPRATLDADAMTRAEAVAEREAVTTDCERHVERNDAHCRKVSTNGNTTVARCYVDAESAMAAIHDATDGWATSNAKGVGVSQNQGACVYVAVETR